MAKKASRAKPVKKVRFSIGAKLISIISIIVIFSLTAVTFIVSYFVSKDTRISAEENNLTINSRTAGDCESRINSVISSTEMFLDLVESSKNEVDLNKNENLFFERYADIAAVYLPTVNKVYINRQFFMVHEISPENFDNYLLSESDSIQESGNGSFILKNASPVFQTQLMAIFTPIYSRSYERSLVILYSTESLYESFSSGSINQSYFVNQDGEILIHPDMNLMMAACEIESNSVYDVLKDSKANNEQKYYFDANNQEFIGAYTKIKNSNSAVITSVFTSVVLEAINATTRRNLYLTIAILSIVIMILWLFSRSMSIPLKKLADVANEINNANFNTPIFDELYTKRHDEIAVLMNSTKNEREILNTITRLTNIGVVKSVVRKEVDFNPHLKDITIFFSDIRGFTAISDGFNSRFGNNSGAEIIGFLNDYMSRMVQCITLTGGTVDKFEGDAIMACWGVLRNDSLDFEDMPDGDPDKERLKAEHEKHKKEDALSAITATVAMRYSLRKYNKDAEIFTEEHKDEADAKYKPHIRIGSGLNSGRATVGFMGSWEKMEFTSIGDAVNLASRTESSNKPCGTDILITQDTYDLLKMEYIKCPENNFTIKEENKVNEVIVEMIPVAFEVKGKGKQHFYGVVNMPEFDVQEFYRRGDPEFTADVDCLDVVGPKGPETLSQMRKLLGIPEPDFGGVNLDESENKIQVSAN
ncbi:MAG: adenylate/guanylate cyclase domain-containing protein [Treponemataceae bacterium]|nr:adenylate/guanylate cyclase domain-containing protein [Treponemataceae bacterium]